MKIALVLLHADPNRGGAERYTLDVARGLHARGHAVSIVATTFPELLPGITTVHLPTPQSSRTRRYKSFLYQFETHLHIAPYDVIHAMLPITKCDIYHPHAGLAIDAVKNGHRKHANVVKRYLALAGNYLNRRRRMFAAVEKRLLTRLHRPLVLCLSDYVKKTVQEHYDLPESHTPVLYNGVDLAKYDPALRPAAGAELRQKLNIADNVTLGLFVGQDFERKGLTQAIKALADVNNNPHGAAKPWTTTGAPASAAGVDAANLKLLVVGKGNPRPYRQLAQSLGVANRVIFAGPTADAYAAYRAADFLLLPTRHDPCSLVVLEALAMGLPIISTRQNGAAELITEGVQGFVLENPDDGAGLAAAVRAVCDRAALSAAKAQATALRTRLSFERHLDELEALYQRAPGHWK